jgi:hypothetical protein
MDIYQLVALVTCTLLAACSIQRSQLATDAQQKMVWNDRVNQGGNSQFPAPLNRSGGRLAGALLSPSRFGAMFFRLRHGSWRRVGPLLSLFESLHIPTILSHQMCRAAFTGIALLKKHLAQIHDGARQQLGQFPSGAETGSWSI